VSLSIQVDCLRRTYGSSWKGRLGLSPPVKRALDGISFTIREGERVGIVGPNGAGKSTLLHILASTAAPTSGRVDISGRVHAILTLGLGLREDLTGRQNLRLEAEIAGGDLVPTELDAMADFAGLGDALDEPVRTYSSGMKARLAFAGLVTIHPEILLVDEALSVGDHLFAVKAKAAIRRLCGEGRIVVIVSHDLEAVADLCDRVLWLDQGRLVADGPPNVVLPAYAEDARKHEDANLAAQFADREPPWSANEHATITALTIASPGMAARIDPAQPAIISGDVALARDLREAGVALSIERLDGLIVDDRVETLGELAPCCLHVEFKLSRALLAPGHYRAVLELLLAGAPIARRATLFESAAEGELRGGRPVLFAPIEVSTQPVR